MSYAPPSKLFLKARVSSALLSEEGTKMKEAACLQRLLKSKGMSLKHCLQLKPLLVHPRDVLVCFGGACELSGLQPRSGSGPCHSPGESCLCHEGTTAVPWWEWCAPAAGMPAAGLLAAAASLFLLCKG